MDTKQPQNQNKKKIPLNYLIIAGLAVIGLALLCYFLFINFSPRKAPPVLVSSVAEASSLPASSTPDSSETSSAVSSGSEVIYPTDKLFVTKGRNAYKDGEMLLSVPRFELVDTPVLDGTDADVIDHGVGLYDYAQLPGKGNFNTSITAHRNMEFEFINTVTNGDFFYLKYQGIEYTFEYEETIIIKDDDWSIINCREYPIATLISCHPVNSSKNRMCVIGKLVSQKEIPATSSTAESSKVESATSSQKESKPTTSSQAEPVSSAPQAVTLSSASAPPPPTQTATPKTTVLTPSADGTNESSGGGASIDASNISEGYVMVKYDGSATKLKVQITGPDAVTYTYSLRPGVGYETFPLTAGNGSYKVSVHENIGGTSYATPHTNTFDVAITDPMKPYLYPSQYVNFTKDSKTVAKGESLVSGSKTETEMVEKVYNYVIKNIKYDDAKASSVKSGYVPVVDDTLSSGKGICFDYAAVMATMLRTQNIPTRLEVGYASGNIYHAWISVHLKDKGWVNGIIQFDGKSWKLMDPTFASNGNGSDSIMKFIGNGSNYATKYVY